MTARPGLQCFGVRLLGGIGTNLVLDNALPIRDEADHLVLVVGDVGHVIVLVLVGFRPLLNLRLYIPGIALEINGLGQLLDLVDLGRLGQAAVMNTRSYSSVSSRPSSEMEIALGCLSLVLRE